MSISSRDVDERNERMLAETITLSVFIAKLQAELVKHGDLPIFKEDDGMMFEIDADWKLSTDDLDTSRGPVKVVYV